MWIVLFYTLMEVLQTFQYEVVNQCDDSFNVMSTNLAYLLVIVQPLMWNAYFGYNHRTAYEGGLFDGAIGLCLVWIVVNLSARMQVFSHVPLQTRNVSIYAGPVCVKRDASHLYWKWTATNYRDLNANMLMYLATWFVPALFSDQFRGTICIIIASALLGAVMAWEAGELLIFTAAWCYISIPTVLFIFGFGGPGMFET